MVKFLIQAVFQVDHRFQLQYIDIYRVPITRAGITKVICIPHMQAPTIFNKMF